MGNPTAFAISYPWFFNALFLGNSRSLITDTAVTGDFKFFPALEQLSLRINAVFQNLYNSALGSFRAIIWIAKGTKIVSAPTQCSIINQQQVNGSYPINPPNSLLSPLTYLDCTPSSQSLGPFEMINSTFTLFIEDITITQARSGIIIAQPQASYVESSRSNIILLLFLSLFFLYTSR